MIRAEKEPRIFQFEDESFMNTLNKPNILMRSLEKTLEDEKLNGTPMKRIIKRGPGSLAAGK